MITDKVLLAAESVISSYVNVHVLGEDEAYPTSGYRFVKVIGNGTDIRRNQDNVIFVVTFSVICSLRTREYPTQEKRVPYLELIDLQEQIYFSLVYNDLFIVGLRNISPNIEPMGYVTSNRLNTRAVTVPPEFFGSVDNSAHPIREAGYKLEQYYKTPPLSIPVKCLSIPSDLESQLPTVT